MSAKEIIIISKLYTIYISRIMASIKKVIFELKNDTNNRKIKYYSILVFLSLFLFFLNIYRTSPVLVDTSDFLGLASHLDLSYWIGLISVSFCSVLIYRDNKFSKKSFFIIVLMVIGLYLFGIGIFSEENPRAWSSYYPPGEVKNLLLDQEIDITSKYPLISYRSWPVIHFLSSSLIYVAGINLDYIIKYMPLFWVICFIFITYSAGIRFGLDLQQAFILSTLAITSFFQIYYYYSPQSLAYLSALTLFTLIAAHQKRFSINICIITIFFVLVMSHLLYSLIFIVSALVYSILNKRGSILFLFAIIFLTWYIFLTPDVFDMSLNRLFETGNILDAALFSQFDKFSPKTPEMILLNTFRFAYLFVYIIIFILCVYRFRNADQLNRRKIFDCFSFLICLPLIGFLNYGAESMERAFIFTILPLLCIFVMSNFSKNAYLAVFILFITIHMPAHYGTESFLMTHTSELAGSEFFASNVETSYFNSTLRESYIYLADGDRYVSYFNPKFVTVATHTINYIKRQKDINFLKNVKYIFLGPHDKNKLILNGDPDLLTGLLQNKDVKNNVQLIYNNKKLIIFKCNDIEKEHFLNG